MRKKPVTEVVDYADGGHQAPVSEIRLDLSGLPNSVRRDHVRAARMAAEQARAEQRQ